MRRIVSTCAEGFDSQEYLVGASAAQEKAAQPYQTQRSILVNTTDSAGSVSHAAAFLHQR